MLDGIVKHRRQLRRHLFQAMERARRLEPATSRADGSDLAERKCDERHLRQLAAVVESSEDAIVTADRDGSIQSWNGAAERLYGYRAAEAIGQPVGIIAPPEQGDEPRDLLAKALAGARLDRHETQRVAKDGTVIDVSLTVSPIRDSRGGVEQVSVIVRDIRPRKRAEAILRQRVLQQEAIADLGIAALELRDVSALIGQALETLARVLRADACEVLEIAADRESMLLRDGVGWKHGLVGTARVPYSSDVYAAFALGSPDGAFTEDYETEPRFRPSRILTDHGLKCSAAVTIGHRGLPTGVLGVHFKARRAVSRDEAVFLRVIANIIAHAMERSQAAQQLAASDRRYRQIIETANEGIWVYDANRVTTFVNSAMAEMLGHTVQEMEGRAVVALMDGEGARVAEGRIAAREQGSRATYDFPFRHKDGSEVWGLVSASPMLDETGEIVGGLAMVTDITDRLRVQAEKAALEADIQQAQRLESVGQLAGGIAHDFNNILAVIQNYAEFALAEVDEGPVRDDVEQIRLAAERAARLTRQLLVFSRREVVAPEVLGLGDVVADTDKLLRRTIGEHIELISRIGADVPPVKADRGQLEQVLVNLAVNARDAMPDGGMLTIETAPMDLDEGFSASGAHSVPPGEYAQLTVSDTGTGMSSEQRARAFEPFFTTKAPGSGTGLGLATVYGIVKQAGGHINIYSEEGLGTSVKIYLPVTTDEPAESPAAKDGSPLGSGQQVLVVEDDPAVGDVTQRILTRHGYRVLPAAGGEEALGICREVGQRIDLLLTDLVMPGMSGSQLAHQATALIPSLRVLYMSGYTDDVVIRHGMNGDGWTLLEKPFGSGVLLRRVAETLGAWRPGSDGDLP